MSAVLRTEAIDVARPHDLRTERTSLIVGRSVTAMLVVGPLVAISVALPFMWGWAIGPRDVLLALGFYVVTGFGITVGYHRLFTHRSFCANRWLRIALGAAGSLAVEGSVTSWVACHRRHHVFSDQPGDPHSPHRFGPGAVAQLRGFAHAHVGWLFRDDPTSATRYAADVLRDPDSRLLSRLFPLFAVSSFAAPFFLGWTLSGAISGALTALLWAGLVRMVLLHHVTWSVNSVCHMIGRQPATDKDRSRNVAPLALVSFGDSWHNFHHAHPASARHGALRRQIDPSAALIRLFERVGLATSVRWPTNDQITSCGS